MGWGAGPPLPTGTDRPCLSAGCTNKATHETYLFWAQLEFGNKKVYCDNVPFALCKKHLKELGIPKGE